MTKEKRKKSWDIWNFHIFCVTLPDVKIITPILTISGSDGIGSSGIQADIKTITSLGGDAMTVITCMALNDGKGMKWHRLHKDVIVDQARTIMDTMHPKAAKIGLIQNPETIKAVRDEVIGCKRIVCAPGIFSSDGSQLIDDESIRAIITHLIPESTLLMLRCNEAEKMLGKKISSDDEMEKAARELHSLGAEWVMLRGGQLVEGRLTALLYGEGKAHFFTSYNIEGWKRHGVGSALAAAITTRLGMGDDVPTAINNAHKYVHSRVVYAVSDAKQSLRATDIYNEMMSLVAAHYQKEHSVAFYADKLNITTRYLSKVTDNIVGKSPKQVISDYLMNEAKMLLDNSRLTIQEISDKLGFSSQTIFSKFFKEQEKLTPTEYRR